LKEEALDRTVWGTGFVQTMWHCREADRMVKECGRCWWRHL